MQLYGTCLPWRATARGDKGTRTYAFEAPRKGKVGADRAEALQQRRGRLHGRAFLAVCGMLKYGYLESTDTVCVLLCQPVPYCPGANSYWHQDNEALAGIINADTQRQSAHVLKRHRSVQTRSIWSGSVLSRRLCRTPGRQPALAA